MEDARLRPYCVCTWSVMFSLSISSVSETLGGGQLLLLSALAVPVVYILSRTVLSTSPTSATEQTQDTDGDLSSNKQNDKDEEKPKRKRGRPRKSEAAQLEEMTSELDAQPENELREDDATAAEESSEQPPTVVSTGDDVTQTEKKRGGKETSLSVSPLKETDRNALGRSQSTISDSDKSMSKSIASSQAGKVSYRVGLSKKSRIAPLLKIIRK